MGIVEALPVLIESLVAALPTIMQMLVEGILRCLPQLIKGSIQLVFGIVSSLDKILASLRQALPNAFKGIWAGVKNVFKDCASWFGNIFTNAKNKIAQAFSNIKEKLSAPFEKARDTIKGIADKIKGFFKGEISMPKIKMPHFKVSPSGWKIGDLLKGSIPKLGIEWYAKAMDNPQIMTKPTVFGYNPATGNLQAGGEVPGGGGEMIGGTNTIMSMISSAVAEPIGALEYYMQKIIEILGKFFPQILEAMAAEKGLSADELARMLAEPIDVELGRRQLRKARGRA
jgi:hypothetical protein